MLTRLTQISRHLPRQFAHRSYTFAGGSVMTSLIEERSKRMIHTAGCIIIGDEVLGGKVCFWN